MFLAVVRVGGRGGGGGGYSSGCAAAAAVLVYTFWCSVFYFLASAASSSTSDMCLRFRGCPVVVLDIELSVSARYQKMRARCVFCCSVAEASGINFEITCNESKAKQRFWANQSTRK